MSKNLITGVSAAFCAALSPEDGAGHDWNTKETPTNITVSLSWQ